MNSELNQRLVEIKSYLEKQPLTEALAPLTPDEIGDKLDAIERQLKSARSSTDKLRRDPQKYAPQRENVMFHLKQISAMARSVMMREKSS